MATRILLSSVAAVPPVAVFSVPICRQGWHRFVITVLASKTRTLDGIFVALTSKAEATDGSDGVHVEADLFVGRLRLGVQVDRWL